MLRNLTIWGSQFETERRGNGHVLHGVYYLDYSLHFYFYFYNPC
jgi:hypothetical protein